jgi:hypothetical protein
LVTQLWVNHNQSYKGLPMDGALVDAWFTSGLCFLLQLSKGGVVIEYKNRPKWTLAIAKKPEWLKALICQRPPGLGLVLSAVLLAK